MPESIDRVTISPILQTLYIFLSFFIITYITSLHVTRPPILEKQTFDLQPVTPQKINEYGGRPDEIEIGLHIKSFSEFDIVKNTFIFSGILWFRLYPQTISLEELKNVTLMRGHFTYISEPAIQLQNKRMLVMYDVAGKFSNPINYKNFPIDSHRIYLGILHQGITPKEGIFTTSQRNFVFRPNLVHFGWQFANRNTETGMQVSHIDAYNEYTKREYPTAIFSIDVTRASTRHISSIMLPLLMLIYFVTLSFSTSFSTAIWISADGIAAIIAYRFVIENMSPSAGYYMISDYFFLLALVCVFLLFICNVIDKHLYALPLAIKHLIILSIHGLTLGSTMFILFA